MSRMASNAGLGAPFWRMTLYSAGSPPASSGLLADLLNEVQIEDSGEAHIPEPAQHLKAAHNPLRLFLLGVVQCEIESRRTPFNGEPSLRVRFSARSPAEFSHAHWLLGALAIALDCAEERPRVIRVAQNGAAEARGVSL